MPRYVVVLVFAMGVVAVFAASTKKCSPNEVWSWCGKSCEPTCNILQPGWTVCPDFQCSKDRYDCRCKPGLVRNEKGKCVNFETCKHKFG